MESPTTRFSLSARDPQLAALTKELSSTKLFNEPVSHTSLLTLGEKLQLNSNQRIRINTIVFRLTDSIQGFHVGRFYVSGSYGRRVTVGRPEIDLVVFLRNSNRLPPYTKSNDDAIPKLHALLTENFSGQGNAVIAPLTPGGCFLGDCKRGRSCHKKKEPKHRCCEEFISLQIDEIKFRIFIAPSLGRTSEEQRQATYRKMQEAYVRKGLQGLDGWNPSLIERPSEFMAQAKPQIQAFIRMCQYWIQINSIPSMERYAVETLALLVSYQIRNYTEQQQQQQQQQQHSETNLQCHNEAESIQENCPINLLEGFKRFLLFCTQLQSVSRFCEIESPASYISPFSNLPSEIPILTDRFNPYCNLLESITLHDKKQLAASARHTLKLLASGQSTVTLDSIFRISPRIPSHRKSLCGGASTLLSILIVVISSMYISRIFQRHNWNVVWDNIPNDTKHDIEWSVHQLQWLWVVIRQWCTMLVEFISGFRRQLYW